MVLLDAVARRLPGALAEGSGELESFSAELDGGLEYPHYTRPAEFRGWSVPDVLLSGDHAKIDEWRREQSRQRAVNVSNPYAVLGVRSRASPQEIEDRLPARRRSSEGYRDGVVAVELQRRVRRPARSRRARALRHRRDRSVDRARSDQEIRSAACSRTCRAGARRARLGLHDRRRDRDRARDSRRGSSIRTASRRRRWSRRCTAPGRPPAARPHFSDRVLANRFIYHFRDPKRGEIIVFKTPPGEHPVCGAGAEMFVKRLIGLPGRRHGRSATVSSTSTARS